MLLSGEPNACNLCHLDRSLGWTLDQLAAEFVVDVQGERPTFVDEPMGPLWLAQGSRAARIAAASAYAERREPAGVPHLVSALDDPIAYDRMRIYFALRDLLGEAFDETRFDPAGTPSQRAGQQSRLEAEYGVGVDELGHAGRQETLEKR